MTVGVKELCERYAVNANTVYGWLADGALKGINVARGTDRRPKWRFTESAIAAFESARGSIQPRPVARRESGYQPQPGDVKIIN